MGKTWDSFVPGPSIWREVYRVLKPGGYALVFAGTRTEDLMSIALRLAGFERRDVIEWLYFSGFPKSLDVGKAFDRRRDEDLPHIYAVTKFIAEARDRAGLKNSDIDAHFGLNGMAGHWTSQKSQPQVPKWEQWLELKALLGLGDEMDAEVWRLNGRKGKPGEAWGQREKIGEYEYKRKGNGTWDAESPGGIFGAQERIIDITAPATDLAKKWDGWGTALKPAHEPIIVARKPLIGTVAENVERYGTGAINIDGCRIGDNAGWSYPNGRGGSSWHNRESLATNLTEPISADKGRFPANCVTTEPDAFFSPYFNVSPPELSKKASKRDRNSDVNGADITVKNVHPTVKSTDLMAWLVRLVTPPGGVVLDPFAGSGSTLVAAKREGFQFIGIERDAEYVEIARARTLAEAANG